ncbi:MAG: DNA recombination-mediator protein A [Candidatus Sericytochromatia bacterium]|nr:DNA recombination-mediator protein A [Candidatus Sericytochromatia bacterium]
MTTPQTKDQSTKDGLSVDTFLSELRLIQETSSKRIALIGSRHISFTHQQLIEMLAYALALSGNHIITSGASGTNFAAIKGVQRANPGNLTVILPQTLDQQASESREQLSTLPSVQEHPERRALSLAQAGELCYREIVDECQQLICFLYHGSTTLKETIAYAHEQHKIVTSFYLD